MKKAIPLLWACGIAAITSASTLTSSSDKVDAEVYRAIDVTANEPMELKLHSGAFVWPEEIAPKAAIQTKVKTLTSVADLVGGYVQTSKTLVPTACRDAGNATKISLGTAPDQIVIERFWSNLYTGGEYIKVTANVDVATSVVSIPAQVVFTDANYGAISLVVSGQDGQPMRDASITGTIADDGTIQFTDPWGLYVDSGEHKDKYIYANYATTLRPANATLYFRSYDAPDLMYSYDIYVADNGDNTITVTNMGNAGLEINATLNGNRTISFPYETLMWYPYALNNQNYFFSFSMVSDFAYDPEKKSIQYFQYGLTTFPAEAGDNTTASFGNWALLSTSMGSAYGINSEGMIQLKNGMTFNYPTDYDADFEGSGTEDDPYLIKTVDNLNALALSVNQAKAANNQAIRVYSGVHFKLMADLDLSSIEFTPIGQDSYHCFDGVFDGNGHQIKGMRMNRKNNIVYNGLFGWAGQNSVISNLTVVSPDITSNFYTGIIAAYSSGTVSDCHVVNPVIHNNAQISGGIVGESFGRIINCTVTGAEIYGLGGYAGGIVGEISGHQEVENGPTIKGEISGCSVTDTYINAWTSSDDGSRAGGVAANVYYSDISDCYFSGVVDCIEEYNYSIATFIAGGVAGSVYGGDISRCFAVGNILVGTYKSEVGGVAGTLGGNMTDCYSAGKVYGAKTVYAGGLTGEVKANPQAFVNNFIKSTIKSSYTSAQTVNDLDNINMTGQLPELIGSVKMTGDMTSYTDLVCIESSYFNSDLTYFGNSDCRSTTAALTSVSGPEGFSSGQWLFEANAYPRLKNLADTEAALMSASSILFPEGSSASALRGAATLNPLGATEFLIADGNQLGTEGTYASIKGKVLEIGNQNGLETIVVSNGSVQYPLDISVMGNGLEGLGTEDSPMLIKNKNDLKILSELVTVDNPFHGVYVKMVNDIDMEQDPDFIGIAVSRVNNTSLRFDGIFDGDGHTIHNMWLNGVVWQDGKTPAEDPEGLGTPNTASGQGIMYQAFIGRLNTNGVLRNLNFAADCADERGSNNCAMAVAENYGTIENVRNYADLKSYGANVGAIVSSNQSSGKIINCFNAGNIYSGKNFAGGIAASGIPPR